MGRIRLVLFDLDGTLVDSAPDLAASANELRRRRGLPLLPYRALREVCGSGARGLVWASLRTLRPCDANFSNTMPGTSPTTSRSFPESTR